MELKITMLCVFSLAPGSTAFVCVCAMSCRNNDNSGGTPTCTCMTTIGNVHFSMEQLVVVYFLCLPQLTRVFITSFDFWRISSVEYIRNDLRRRRFT